MFSDSPPQIAFSCQIPFFLCLFLPITFFIFSYFFLSTVYFFISNTFLKAFFYFYFSLFLRISFFLYFSMAPSDPVQALCFSCLAYRVPGQGSRTMYGFFLRLHSAGVCPGCYAFPLDSPKIIPVAIRWATLRGSGILLLIDVSLTIFSALLIPIPFFWM